MARRNGSDGMNRRQFLNQSFAAGASALGMMSLMSQVRRRLGMESAAFADEAKKLAAPTSTEGPDLIMRGWAYYVDTVRDNIDIFQKQYGEHVDYKTITGDYIALIENLFIAEERLDLVYCADHMFYRWRVADWTLPGNIYWDYEKAAADMYPAVLDALTVEGNLAGYPYFTSIRGTLCTNEIALEKAGVAGEYPKTWKELYEQCYKIRDKGVVDYPLLPHWLNTWFGITPGFLFECKNQGIELFDTKTNAPVFDETHEAVRVLEDWRRAVVDKLVPTSILTMQETDHIDAFAQGNYAYSPQQNYDSKEFNNPEKSNIAGKSKFATFGGQPWGHLQIGLYMLPHLPNNPRDDLYLARAMRLVGWFGYRDINGVLHVAKRWAIENALNSGYKEILQDADVQAAYAKWMPDPEGMLKTMGQMYDVAQFLNVEKTPWYVEWQTEVLPKLGEAALGQKTPKEVITFMRSKADELVEEYAKIEDELVKRYS